MQYDGYVISTEPGCKLDFPQKSSAHLSGNAGWKGYNQ